MKVTFVKPINGAKIILKKPKKKESVQGKCTCGTQPVRNVLKSTVKIM
jgi:hypothetical protein